MNYHQWLTQAIMALQQANPNENGKRDAIVLLQAVTGRTSASILAFGETEISQEIFQKLTALLNRRLQGEPIAYILGEKEFWSLPLKVSPDTLIPRPDTEILVEKAVEIAAKMLQLAPKNSNFKILDLGTGTGAIALALSQELSPLAKKRGVNLEIFGVDRIAKAVALAQENAELNQLDVTFLQSDWFEALNGQKFHLIVSNPPYIDENDPHLMQGDVRFEPHSALVAPNQGLGDLQKIIQNAPRFLPPNGWLLLEHGWQQGAKVRSIFEKFSYGQIETILDYSGNERVSCACWTQLTED